MSATPRQSPSGYRIRGPETWAVIREQYLSGVGARLLAERYGVPVRTIWVKASKEGWTKRSRETLAVATAASPERRRSPLLPAGRLDVTDLHDEALLASVVAMREGRPEEAQRLARLAESYSRLASGRPWLFVR